MTLKIKYDEFYKNIETDTNFYFRYSENSREKVIVIQKRNCTLELMQFIRNKIKPIENCLGEKIKFILNNKLKHKKIMKIIVLILTVVSLLSILGGLYTFGVYNQINEIQNINLSAWLFWLWLPIPIVSISVSYAFYKKGLNCSKNITIISIIIILLLISGMFSIIPFPSNDNLNNYNIIQDYKPIMNVKIPDSGKLNFAVMKSFNNKNISDLKIITVNYRNEDTTELDNDIMNNDNWILSTQLSSDFTKLIPSVFTSSGDIFYLFYNITIDQYNTIPNEVSRYQFYTIQYDISKKMLIIYNFCYNCCN